MTQFYTCTLSDVLKRRAEVELNEPLHSRDQEVEAFRKLVEESLNLHYRTDYDFLLRFLRSKKFDHERAAASIHRYHEVRIMHPEIFSSYYPSSVEQVLKAGVVQVLPRSDIHGRRIVMLKPGLWNPDCYPVTDVMKTVLLSIEWLIRDEATQVNGIVLLEDYKEVGWRQLKQISRDKIKLMTYLVQEAFPVRLKAIHILNAPAIMNYLFPILRMFFKPKIRERFYVHGKQLGPLLEDVGAECLPTDYQGTFSLEENHWANQMLSSEVDFYFHNLITSKFSCTTAAAAC